jgi:hypothetical protein
MLGSYRQASIQNQVVRFGDFRERLLRSCLLRPVGRRMGVVKRTVGRRISIETPAFDGVLTEVQSARTREFRWFIGLWAKFFSQGLLWSPRTHMAEQS